MAEGKLEAKDFMMLGLFEKMMRRDAKLESKRDLDEEEGDSDGEDLDRSRRGLRQVNDLNQIALDIKVHPTRIIKEFERASALSLGVKPGMPWTLQDVRKIGNWGKHFSLQRCAALDLEAYMLLPARTDDIRVLRCKAQLIQGYRAKLQAAMDGGNWNQGWLLTGLPDPCQRSRFAAPPDQLAAVSGYLKAIAEIRKGASLNNTPEVESPEDGSNDRQPRNGNRKAKGKANAKDD